MVKTVSDAYPEFADPAHEVGNLRSKMATNENTKTEIIAEITKPLFITKKSF